MSLAEGDFMSKRKNLRNIVEGLESRVLFSGAPTQLAFVPEPGNTTAGASNPVTVDVEDSDGNVVSGDNSTVSLLLYTTDDTIVMGFGQQEQAVNGVATFPDASVSTPGTYMFGATDSEGAFGNTFSNEFTVGAAVSGNSRHLVFKTNTGSGTAGDPISPSIIVKIENADDKVVTTASKTITLSVATGPGEIKGTVSVAAVDGKATFDNVKFRKAGTYTLTASGNKDTSVTSGDFTIKHAAASQLVYDSSIESSVGTGDAISPPIVVDIEDAFGNLCTGSTAGITLAIKGDAGSDILQGTLTVHASGGQATFGDISFTTAGTYKLKATHGTLTKAVSGSITVS
jgi:hypothetical protein